MKTIYDVDFFIKKFQAIPEELWCINTQHDGNGRHCAFGWCREEQHLSKPSFIEYNGADTNEGKSLIKLFESLFDHSFAGNVAFINNGEISEYQQPTPKQRILAALHDIKAMQQPKEESAKVIYKVVEVDRQLMQEVRKERILN